MPSKTRARTVGELRRSRYRVLPVREEMRKNLVRKLTRREPLFPGIVGFDDTVVPQIENAILAGQDIGGRIPGDGVTAMSRPRRS